MLKRPFNELTEQEREAVEVLLSRARAAGRNVSVDDVLWERRPEPGGEVVVEEVPPELRTRRVDGLIIQEGKPLRVLLDEFGGYEGQMVHPATGSPVHVSLEEWRGADPDEVWLAVSFITWD
jgi:hypothetical protein